MMGFVDMPSATVENLTLKRLAGMPRAEESGDTGGCKHYRRRCDIRAPCCQSWWTCHLCHDEAMQSSCGHALPRYSVSEVRCKMCGNEQKVAAACTGCGTVFADYFCATCKLFARPSLEGIYHCEACGICRVGQGLGKTHFHCITCCQDPHIDDFLLHLYHSPNNMWGKQSPSYSAEEIDALEGSWDSERNNTLICKPCKAEAE